MSAATAPLIDLRSDTVTRPTPAMRAAMASAEVGDDVFGEDPTVNRLQERTAALLGKEAALFVPSGTMANQLALLSHCQPGDEVLVGEGAHVALYEGGAAAAVAGVQLSVLGRGGLFRAEDIAAAFAPASDHNRPTTRLVCIENTHNRGGGICWPPAQLLDVATTARAHDLAIHLDGARLLHVAAATGLSAATLAAPADSVSLAFSKGLGAPVGSVLAGSRALVDRAHRFRKRLGGGMRQAGVIAAGALHALDHHVARLADDHAHARRLAERLASVPGLAVDLSRVQTNIVLVDLGSPLPAAQAVVNSLRARGVLCLAFGPRRLRFVTHLDVGGSACAAAAEIVAEVITSLQARV